MLSVTVDPERTNLSVTVTDDAGGFVPAACVPAAAGACPIPSGTNAFGMPLRACRWSLEFTQVPNSPDPCQSAAASGCSLATWTCAASGPAPSPQERADLWQAALSQALTQGWTVSGTGASAALNFATVSRGIPARIPTRARAHTRMDPLTARRPRAAISLGRRHHGHRPHLNAAMGEQRSSHGEGKGRR
jgi:hypothetical protein